MTTPPASIHRSHTREIIYMVVIVAFVAYVLLFSGFTSLNLLAFIAVTLAIWLPDWA